MATEIGETAVHPCVVILLIVVCIKNKDTKKTMLIFILAHALVVVASCYEEWNALLAPFYKTGDNVCVPGPQTRNSQCYDGYMCKNPANVPPDQSGWSDRGLCFDGCRTRMCPVNIEIASGDGAYNISTSPPPCIDLTDLHVAASTGYRVTDVRVDGISVGPISPQAEFTIAVRFMPDTVIQLYFEPLPFI